jgi:hypothetical protein
MVTAYVPGKEPVVYGTVTARLPLVELRLFASPEYTAVTVCDPARENEVWYFAAPWFRPTGVPDATPSRSNCTVPEGVEFDPIEFTVAVNVSVAPFAGVLVSATSEVVVWFGLYWIGDELPPPPPQLIVPRRRATVATIESVRVFLFRLGTAKTTTNATDSPIALAVHPKPLCWFRATGPAPTDWACVVVIVIEVLPEAVSDDGEKTHADCEGSPEQEKLTVPANPFNDPTWIVTGDVVWPFVTVSVFRFGVTEKSGITIQ